MNNQIIDYENKMTMIMRIELLTDDVNAILFVLQNNPKLFPCLDITDDLRQKLISLMPSLTKHINVNDDDIISAVYKNMGNLYDLYTKLSDNGIIKLVHKFKNDKRYAKVMEYISKTKGIDFIISNFDDVSIINLMSHEAPKYIINTTSLVYNNVSYNGVQNQNKIKLVDDYISRYPIDTTESLQYLIIHPELIELDNKYRDLILPYVIERIFYSVLLKDKPIKSPANYGNLYKVYYRHYLRYITINDFDKYFKNINDIKIEKLYGTHINSFLTHVNRYQDLAFDLLQKVNDKISLHTSFFEFNKNSYSYNLNHSANKLMAEKIIRLLLDTYNDEQLNRIKRSYHNSYVNNINAFTIRDILESY